MRYDSEQTCHSENSTNTSDTSSITTYRQKEKKYAQKHQKCIKIVPPILKKVLWTYRDDPNDKFDQKEPNEDWIEYVDKSSIVEAKVERIDEWKDDQNADYGLKQPMMHDKLKMQFFLAKSSELHPSFNIIECWRYHSSVLNNYLTQLHELVDLLNRYTLTIVLLWLSSILRQMSVINSTYLIL